MAFINDIKTVITGFVDRATLLHSLSLVNRDWKAVARDEWALEVSVDKTAILRYSLLKNSNMGQAPLPLHRTKRLQVVLGSHIGIDELLMLHIFLHDTDMHPKVLVVHGSLLFNQNLREYYKAYMLPLKPLLVQVKVLTVFCELGWTRDVLLWLSLTPNAYKFSGGTQYLLPSSPRAPHDVYSVNDRVVDLVTAGELTLSTDAPRLLGHTFSIAHLHIHADPEDQLLDALRGYQLDGMAFQMTSISIDILYWSSSRGLDKFWYLLEACLLTLQTLSVARVLPQDAGESKHSYPIHGSLLWRFRVVGRHLESRQHRCKAIRTCVPSGSTSGLAQSSAAQTSLGQRLQLETFRFLCQSAKPAVGVPGRRHFDAESRCTTLYSGRAG